MLSLTVDCETTGLLEKDRPFIITYVHEDKGYLVDLRKNPAPQDFQLKYQLSEVTFQNAKFDMRMIYNQLGILPEKVRDLEVLARLVNNEHMSYSLSNIAKRNGLEKLKIVDEYITEHELHSQYKDEYRTEKLLHFDKVPDEVMYPYATNDAVITNKLYDLEYKKLDSQSYRLLDVENALTLVCFKMERAGVKVDLSKVDEAIEQDKKIISNAKRKFLLRNGEVFDNTKEQMIRIFTKEGLVIPKTDKGNYSLDAEALDSFDSPSADIIKDIRYYEKRISTYFSAFKYYSHDGILHPDMRQAGTKTGRFSYRDPNLQNLPKGKNSKDLITVKDCLVPKNDMFVSLDFAQQEYRIMLAYANEAKLIKEIMAGADVHQATADLLGVDRSIAKHINFGILYGMGISELAKALKVSLKEAKEIKETYFGKLPKVLDLIQRIKSTAISRGHVYNWLGRKLSLDNPKFAYAIPNHLIQSSGADACKLAMVNIDKRFGGCSLENYPMVLQVHDALVLDISDGQDAIVRIVKEEMEKSFPEMNGMKLAVDVTYSRKSLNEGTMLKWN